MKLVCLFLCVVVTAESTIIVDKIKSGVGAIKCGFHKVGNVLFRHDHMNNPCAEKPNTIDEDVDKTTPVIDVRDNGGDEPVTSVNPQKPVDNTNARRIIMTGSNCPAGQRADSRGNCREEY